MLVTEVGLGSFVLFFFLWGETDKSSGKWGMGLSSSTHYASPFTNQSAPADGRPGMGNRSRLKVLGVQETASVFTKED